MALSETAKVRLAFIRHLLVVADREGASPEPLRSASLLLLHDAVELFLLLAAEQLDVKVGKDTSLDALFGTVSAKLEPAGLTRREQLRRLNTARVGLKHHGTHPSRHDLQEFRSVSEAFFSENCDRVFGLPLSEVSLSALVQWAPVRGPLLTSEERHTSGELREAVEQTTLAFGVLLQEVSKRAATWTDRRLRHSLPRPGPNDNRSTQALFYVVEELQKSVDHLHEEIATLKLGLDPQELTRFRRLTPQMSWGGDKFFWPPSRSPADDDFVFCFGFVLEAALRFQAIWPPPAVTSPQGESAVHSA